MKDIETKREREKKMVSQMIALYCRRNHHTKGVLCPERAALNDYARARSEHCPFMETKTFCVNCRVHCYKPDMREKIRAVMRFSGPRIIFYHPVAAIRHVVETKREKKRLERKPMKLKRLFFLILGCVCLALGCVGIVLPVLPTVPFFLATVFCFANSLEKLHTWFLGTELYQKHLDSFVKKKGMTAQTKAGILMSVTLLMAVGFFLMLRKALYIPCTILAIVWLCRFFEREREKSCFFGAQRAVEVARGRAAVDEEGRARDERALVAHQKLGDVCDFVRRAGASRRALSEHFLVEVAARAVELVECQRRDDDAGGDVIQARAALAPFDRLRRGALLVAALRHLIGMERVTDVLGLQKVEGQQLLRRRGGELFALLRRQGGHAPAGLVRDRHAHAARCDDPADLF